ncbi:MAG: citrate lyase subunit beta [marine bacterium B5-7]|nr:MAG: citrate lyase subunit beta [marine bacterium B5-7]
MTEHLVPVIRRSVLYLPATNERALTKARQLPADVLIFDLEDSVSIDRKNDARIKIAAALGQDNFQPRECIVRVNGLDSGHFEADLDALVGLQLHGILVPKVYTTQDVKRIEQMLDARRLAADIWIMAETAAGILNIGQIVFASSRISCVVVGTSDLARELRIPLTPGRLGLLAALSTCVLAARSARVDVIDGVHIDIKDERGFAKSCEQARNLGFDGKSLIHPSQIDICNATFTPNNKEIERARRVVDAFHEAQTRGDGVTTVDGQLVEALHVTEAQRVLELRKIIDARIQA